MDAGTPAIVRSAMSAIGSATTPVSTPIVGAVSGERATSTPRRTAGAAGRATCAPAVATRRRRRTNGVRAAISSAAGWSSASRATASCRARGLGAFVHRIDCGSQDHGPVPSPKLIARNVAAVRRFAEASSLAQTTAGKPGVDAAGVRDRQLLSRASNAICAISSGASFRSSKSTSATIRSPWSSVDTDGVACAAAVGRTLAGRQRRDLRRRSHELAQGVRYSCRELSGTFGSWLARPSSALASIEATLAPAPVPGRKPPDAWTAVRLLTEGTDVTLAFVNDGGPETLS